MTFGISGSALAGIAIGGAGLVSGFLQSGAARDAASSQYAASLAGIQEQRRQFDFIQKLLAPYVQGGTKAFEQQQILAGLNGPEAQKKALEAIEGSAAFQSMVNQGEDAILRNASATGGLRGGNVQGALAQFRPEVLSNLIDKQYAQLGGLAGMGQASAAGTAGYAQQSANNITSLLGDQGAALAGAQLARGNAFASIPGAISSGLGTYLGLGGKF